MHVLKKGFGFGVCVNLSFRMFIEVEALVSGGSRFQSLVADGKKELNEDCKLQ